MNIIDGLVLPFVEFAFMRRALVGSVLLALSVCPVGLFLMLRRMSLTGDAMAHAILPGVALGFLVSGLSVVSMTLGGLAAGLVVVVLAGTVARFTLQREDSSLAAFYLISLALGVLLVSLKGSSVDLMHVLFGSVLALNDQALILIGIISSISVTLLILLWRPLVAECVDSHFLRFVSRAGPVVYFVFMILVVLNLVSGFQALGTLLTVGLMMLPASAARFWFHRLEWICLLAILIGILSSYIGLLISYYWSIPSGPSIILIAGAFYLASLLLGRHGLLFTQVRPHKHRIS